MPTNPRELLGPPSRVKLNRIRVAGSVGARAGEVSSDLAVHPLCAGLHWPGELAPPSGRFWVKLAKQESHWSLFSQGSKGTTSHSLL